MTTPPTTIVLSWHPQTSKDITAGGYKRLYEILRRSQHQVIIIDRFPSLYSALRSKNIQIIEYAKILRYSYLKNLNPILYKFIDRLLTIVLILFHTLTLPRSKYIVYVPYSELVELTIPGVIIKFWHKAKLVLCNLNVNTYFVDRPLNVLFHKFADKIITISKSLQSDLRSSGITASALNGIGFTFPQIPKTKYRKDIDAIFIGRHIPQKGINDLIAIWDLLVNKYNANLKLVTIGDIPDYMKAQIKSKINQLGLKNNIATLGPVSEVKKISLLMRSKVMVFPSHQEGWGIAPMEALSLSLPVISYGLNVYQESIGQTEAFVAVPEGDIESFSKKVLIVLDQLSKYSKISKNWRPPLDWDTVSKREWQLICTH